MSVKWNLAVVRAAAAVFFAGILCNSVVLAYDLPGIPPSGAPAFINPAKAVLNPNSGQLKISGRQDFVFDDSLQTYTGRSAKYTLLGDFDPGGNFLGGTVELRGAIDALGIAPNTMLMMADLTAWNVVDDPMLWGFATDNIVCSPLLLITCTAAESVYVELDRPFSGDFSSKFKSNAIVTTTIPVPASAWLFGSALLLMGWIRKRRSV